MEDPLRDAALFGVGAGAAAAAAAETGELGRNPSAPRDGSLHYIGKMAGRGGPAGGFSIRAISDGTFQ
eukprot:5028025-Pyramimonas_sp.AAC.1